MKQAEVGKEGSKTKKIACWNMIRLIAWVPLIYYVNILANSKRNLLYRDKNM